MIRSRVIGLIAFLLGAQSLAIGQTVQVTLAVDDPVLAIDQTTRLHVFAEIADGMTGNGIYGYALNILEDFPAGIEMTGVAQLGDPLDFFSGPGVFMLDGLHNIYGSDGGFFIDPNRGIGGPFELLTIDLVGRTPGDLLIHAGVADEAATFGIPDGLLLQQPGAVSADFGNAIRITVVPEPATITLLLLSTLSAIILRSRTSRLP